MAIRINVRVDVKAVSRNINKIVAGVSPPAMNKVLLKEGMAIQRDLAVLTPRKWTGITRRSWRTYTVIPGVVRIDNPSKVMGWLEYGTQAHGPKNSKLMFIPLTKAAFNAGPRGVFAARNAARKQGSKPPFQLGKQFILRSRVAGIAPRRIVEAYMVIATSNVTMAVDRYILKLVTI